MDGAHTLMDSSEPVISGIDNIAFLTSLAASGVSVVPASAGESTLTFNLTSLPLTLGSLTSMAKDQRDLAVSGPDLTLAAQNALETLVRITDGSFHVQAADALKADTLTKPPFDDKGLSVSPLNILNSSTYTDTGQSSPGLQFRSAGNGGDTMLSAINYTDNEMLTDSAFDINNSAPPGLGQLDDNLFSGLGNPASGQGSNAFDLFDSSVNDPLSPFGDAGISIDAPSLPAMDSDRTSDVTIDEAKPSNKSSSGSKKTQQQQQLQPQQQTTPPPSSQSGMGSPGKVSVQCPICGKQFNNVSALAKHRLTHSDERKYLCTVCNKGFKRQDHLNGHQMTHLDKKPFGCPLENCDKGYCDARSLRRHLEAHHHLTTDVAQTHVLASMAASGITPPAQRNGKGKSAEAAALAAAAKVAQAAGSSLEGGVSQRIINSPPYSASPTPSPGSGSSQNQFFHFEVQSNKAATTGGSVSVKLDTDLGELGLKKLQEAALQQNNVLQTAAAATGEPGQQAQFQLQFQLQQGPADLLAVVQAQQLQLLQQQQLLQAQQQQQQQHNAVQAVEVKGANSNTKKAKAAKPKEAKLKAQESSPQSNEIGSMDGGISLQSDAAWQEKAQVYNFVGTPGSGEPSPTSLSGELSPGLVPQMSPSPSPGAATPTSPLHNPRLAWAAAHSDKKKDKDSDKGEGPVQCSVCERRFKTLPALNGHMRLHGGYLKKDREDGKRSGSKKSTTSSSSSSTSSSPSTPTDMGPPPPPPRPAHPPIPSQHSPLPPPSPQPQPPSPSIQVVSASTTPLASPQQAAPVGELPAGFQTLYLTDPHTLQQVGINQLSAEVLQQQQQFLQRQLELQQQMAAQLKEEQDIRSLEEQLKQNIHEQQLNSLTPTPTNTPTTPQPQATAVTLSQVNETLADVTRALSPLRAPSPRTQQAEQIQRLVEGFQQVEELHRQQQQQQGTVQLPQLTAQQIEQIQQQHSQLGLPPLQPAQLQQLVQEQLQQQQLIQQQQQAQSLAGLQLGQGHLLLQTQPVNGALAQCSMVSLNTALGTPSILNSVSPMTPGLPGGVLSNGQQLQLGAGTVVSVPASTVSAALTSALQQIPNQLLSQATSSMTTLPMVSTAHQHLTMESLDLHDPSISHLMGHMGVFGEAVGSDLLQLSNSQLGGEAMPGGGLLVQHEDKLPDFHSFHSISSDNASLTSTHPYSIKQDVMLSSASSGLDEALQAAPVKSSHSEIKRRLSADMENSRRPQSISSLTITSLLNKGPAAFTGNFSKKLGESGLGTTNPPSATGRVRMRSKSGDVHKLMRSKSVDHSLMRQRSNTEESIYRHRKRSGDETYIGRSKSHGDDYLSQSDGAGVFRNPSSLPSPFKIKRKHRPSPLFIPPALSSFQSRLRSPRVWDGGEGKGRGHTPPPYTPPPMLSPIRSGSGLFWSMQGARPLTPQSAPVSARLSLSRRGSMGGDVLMDSSAKEGDEESPPPETDIKPHVNIGSPYQADLPPLNPNRKDAQLDISKADLMWDLSVMGVNTDEDVQNYQDFACCAAVKGNGSNVEYALHLLHLAKGDVQTAMLMLMGDPPVLPPGHGLLTYKYQESESWSLSEIQAFHDGLNEFDKDFYQVSRKIDSKSVKECIQFYYLWKKVCPDDYKRLRTLRRKRNQNTLYNLRSQGPDGSGGEGNANQGQDEYSYDGSDSEPEDQMAPNGMMVSEHIDLSMDADMSSVTSSPAAPPSLPPSLPLGQALNPLTAVMQGSLVPPTPPQVLQPAPLPVMTSVAAGLTAMPKCPTPPEPAPTFPCEYPGCRAVLTSKQNQTRHMRKHKEDGGHPAPSRPKPRPSTPSRSPVYDQNGEEIFPCKLCDRVFSKVKSRSAHMKSHKVADPDKKAAQVSVSVPSAAVPSPLSDL